MGLRFVPGPLFLTADFNCDYFGIEWFKDCFVIASTPESAKTISPEEDVSRYSYEDGKWHNYYCYLKVYDDNKEMEKHETCQRPDTYHHIQIRWPSDINKIIATEIGISTVKEHKEGQILARRTGAIERFRS